eukprot:4082782-Prorocentrum_lima.AAC.1
MPMLQHIHLSTGSRHITPSAVLQALQSLNNKETMSLMKVNTCSGLHVCDYHHQHPDFVHVNE